MGALSQLFASGRAADIVLLALGIEFLFLLWRGRDALGVLAALLPGALIVFALRGALTGADWRWIALPLALSFPLNLADLRRRGWLATRRIASGRN